MTLDEFYEKLQKEKKDKLKKENIKYNKMLLELKKQQDYMRYWDEYYAKLSNKSSSNTNSSSRELDY